MMLVKTLLIQVLPDCNSVSQNANFLETIKDVFFVFWLRRGSQIVFSLLQSFLNALGEGMRCLHSTSCLLCSGSLSF